MEINASAGISKREFALKRITIESPLDQQLSEATGQAIVCDAEGRPLLEDLNLDPR
jgi:hypothetical protein